MYNCLKDHPNINLPESKKEIEFIGGDLFKQGGYEWYESLISDSKPGINGDVSVEYIVCPESPELVKTRYPDVKLILVVRNPSKRALSAYYWYFRKNKLQIAENALADALNNVIDKLPKGLETQAGSPLLELLHYGNYAQHLQNYLKHFAAEQIAIINYSDVAKKPKEVMQFVYQYLGVDSGFVSAQLGLKPKQNSGKKWLIKLERLAPKNQLMAFVIDRLHQLFSEKEKAQGPALTKAENLLDAFFKPFNKAFLQLLDEKPFVVYNRNGFNQDYK